MVFVAAESASFGRVGRQGLSGGQQFVADCGSFWQFVAVCESVSEPRLAVSFSFFRCLAESGSFWQFLAVSGSLRGRGVAGAGSFWQFLAVSGSGRPSWREGVWVSGVAVPATSRC